MTTSLHPDEFKGAMGSWAAGVTVVTTKAEGKVYGLTVSSFSSLSADPPLVLVCLMNTNRLPAMMRESGKFGVSILAEGQEAVSTLLSKSGREPVDEYTEFETFEWHTGAPLVRGAVAHVDCEVHEMLPGGDHTIAVGKILGAAFDTGLKPLVYFRRGYRSLNMGD
jgi:flavin reductase (DIM6/NTAB) family NADH-FMN oxidoreductase RutF